MKILMTNMNYLSTVVGGGQGSLQVLAEGLVTEGHDVTVVSLGESSLEGEANGVKTIRLPIKNRYWPFDNRPHAAVEKALWHAADLENATMARDLAEVLDGIRPDVLHTNVMAGWSTAIWEVAKARGVPIVHTLRDYYVVCLRSERFRNGHLCDRTCIDCLPFKYWRSRASKGVIAVVGNSQYILQEHLRLGAFEHSPIKEVIYNGYRPPSPLPDREERTGRLRIGFLGRLAPHKGIEHLLRAMHNLPSGSAELLVAGAGDSSYEKYLINRYSSDDVTFLGFTRPEDLLPRVDVLVVPSIWPEPLPRTAFEAFGFGVPVIGSNRGGIPETIQEGVTGFVFSPDDPLALTRVLESLVLSPEKVDEMRTFVFDRSTDFAPDRVVRSYAAVYKNAMELASEGSRRP